MRAVVGIVGVALVSATILTYFVGIRAGLCGGIGMIGLGMVLDAMRK